MTRVVTLINAPTEVTINGVTVSNTSPMSKTAGGPTPSSRGVICGNVVPQTNPAPAGMICSAKPALVLPDMPDSSLEPSFTFEDIPPPLPSCPPPDSVTNIHWDQSTTDA